MQKYRFPTADIFVTEKKVQFCGKHMKKSKKKVKWHINHKHNEHIIQGVISFNSGKKKVTHNGLTVLNMQSDKESISADVMLGNHQMLVRIQKQNQQLLLNKGSQRNSTNTFQNFKNVFSGEIEDVYEKFYY